MILNQRSSVDNYRMVFFLIVSAFLHVLVYLVADAASLFDPAPPREKKIKKIVVTESAADKKTAEPAAGTDGEFTKQSAGDTPDVDFGDGTLSSTINRWKSAVTETRVVLERKSYLEESKEMYELYKLILIWAEWLLDRASIFLVKLNI